MAMTTSATTVRPYRPGDRSTVRRICYLTGFMGEPVEWMWADEESFADMFSGYYTDREPASLWVADLDGEVQGYLLGCVDSTNAWNPVAVAARHALRRGIAFRRGTAGTLWRGVGDVVVDVVTGRVRPRDYEFTDPAYPAHLHINLLPEARGRGLGGMLVRRWLDELRRLGVPGCHLQTMAENTAAIAFFEAMGFRIEGRPVPAPGERTRSGDRTHVQTMVRPLA